MNKVYAHWCKRVVSKLRQSSVGKQALATVTTQYADEALMLKALRDDEPYDCYDCGDDPETYANELVDEWLIFGLGDEDDAFIS